MPIRRAQRADNSCTRRQAHSGTRAIGFALGHIEVFYDGRHFCLREMAVSPGAQCQGVRDRLLKHVEKRLADAGVSEVSLLTSRGSGTAEFYEKQDYRCLTTMAMLGKTLPTG